MRKLSNKKILIVDDDERFLRALDKTLRNEGAVVTATHWPLNAMDILCHQEAPDLVITDLRMPLVTGGMLLRSMRLMSAALPIIVLTAFGSPETKEDLLRQGATAFLEKSLTADQLLAAIEKVFESQPAVQTPSEPG